VNALSRARTDDSLRVHRPSDDNGILGPFLEDDFPDLAVDCHRDVSFDCSELQDLLSQMTKRKTCVGCSLPACPLLHTYSTADKTSNNMLNFNVTACL
jgi:hypothetical protein